MMAVITAIINAQGLPTDEILDAAGYYQVLSFFLLLFSAIIGPDLVCPDRRDNVIHLYLVRPISALDYVALRWLALFSFALAVLYLGQAFLFAGFTLGADRPLEYLRDNWLDVPRALAAGLVLGVYAATIPLAVSTFTSRRGYAQAFIIGIFFISIPLAAIFTECGEDLDEGPGVNVRTVCEPAAGGAAKWVALVDLVRAPVHVSDMIFDKENQSHLSQLVAELPDAIPVGWFLLLVGTPGLVLWWRYRRISL